MRDLGGNTENIQTRARGQAIIIRQKTVEMDFFRCLKDLKTKRQKKQENEVASLYTALP